MGAWGTGIFDNDETMDFVWEVENRGVEALREAIGAVLDAAGAVESWDETTAIAAAAFIAATSDGRTDLLPENSRTMVADLANEISDDSELRSRARRAVESVLTGESELIGFWRETDDAEEARAAIQEVANRLDG